jgi:hypothetical protein
MTASPGQATEQNVYITIPELPGLGLELDLDLFLLKSSKGRTGSLGSLVVPGFRWWFTSQALSSSGLFTQNVAAA